MAQAHPSMGTTGLSSARSECVVYEPSTPSDDVTRVYYASYGSNMLYRRLMAYISGGTIVSNQTRAYFAGGDTDIWHFCWFRVQEGNTRVHRGCRDSTPPTHSFVSRIPYPLVFAHDSKTWGGGGVAFLDARPRWQAADTPRDTYIRAYCVTLEQFTDIVTQENAGIPATALHRESLRELMAGGPGAGILAGTGWYGYLVFLGCHTDGCPMLTFTCPPEQFERGDLPLNPPGPAYCSVISRGLEEAGVPGGEKYVSSLAARTAELIAARAHV